jgi:hypothetical protein
VVVARLLRQTRTLAAEGPLWQLTRLSRDQWFAVQSCIVCSTCCGFQLQSILDMAAWLLPSCLVAGTRACALGYAQIVTCAACDACGELKPHLHTDACSAAAAVSGLEVVLLIH